nr:hypothetical protein [Tanacetum cinerariifolium]
MDINIDALYNILKQNQCDVNDALGYKKKAIVITSDPLALVDEKMKVSKQKEKVVVSLDSEGNEIFHDAIESANENFIENHIDSQKDYDKSKVDHNDSEEKEHLVDKLIRKFNHKIAKCHKRTEKANQQSKDLENQYKDLQDKYDVLINQVNNFEEKNNEFNEQIKVLNEKNADLLAQMEVLQDQLKRQLVEMNNNVLRLQEKILEKEMKISELEGCVSNKDVEIEKSLERLNECENKLHKIGQTN